MIITPNKNRTITAPIYTSIRTKATNSADNNMNKTAVVARVNTKNIAACITFDVVTTFTPLSKSNSKRKYENMSIASSRSLNLDLQEQSLTIRQACLCHGAYLP